MRKKLIIFSAFALVGCMMVFLWWNTLELYRFKKSVVKQTVEAMISNTARIIQDMNGSLLNNLARVVSDKDFESKMAFAAGFTHNSGKVALTFDDDTAEVRKSKSAVKDTVPVIHTNKEYFKKHNIIFRQDAVLTLHHFDSVLKHDLDSLGIRLAYRLARFNRFDSAIGDTFLSQPFIIDFAQPVIYAAHYVLPEAYIQRQLIPYVGSSVLLLSLLVAGFVFVYKTYINNEKSALFRQVLLGNFAHELKTPVTSLQLIVDAAHRQNDSQMVLSAEHARFAVSEINRMKLLLDKMLSIGKMTREGLEYNREILFLYELVTEAVEAMRSVLDQSGGTVFVSGDDKLHAEGDRALLVNVITVLLDNAVKYGGTPPVINVEVRRHGKDAVIEVADNGNGIPAEYTERIFEPFFRVPTGDVRPVSGHGLGLSFAKEVIKLHNGKLEVNGSAAGAVFTIRLATV